MKKIKDISSEKLEKPAREIIDIIKEYNLNVHEICENLTWAISSHFNENKAVK